MGGFRPLGSQPRQKQERENVGWNERKRTKVTQRVEMHACDVPWELGWVLSGPIEPFSYEDKGWEGKKGRSSLHFKQTERYVLFGGCKMLASKQQQLRTTKKWSTEWEMGGECRMEGEEL